MGKLTEAQRSVLAAGKDIFYRPISRRAWYIADGGRLIKVPVSTFDALERRDFIRWDHGHGVARLYTITDAGRAALSPPPDAP